MTIDLDRFDALRDTDLLACTDTDGVTYKVTGAQFMTLFEPGIPWEDADIKYHVIVTNANDINVVTNLRSDQVAIYNKDTKEKVQSIEAPGEWIIAVSLEAEVRFALSPGTWEFGELNDVSKAENMMGLFEDCANFDGDISDWDTGNVQDMTAMFKGCSNFNQDISGWDTHSARVMITTFSGASSFTQDLSGWCVPNLASPYSHLSFSDGWGAGAKEPVWGTCP